MKLLISLHDVTPAHWDRVRAAEALFERLGVDRVMYLLVPDYHHEWDIRRFADFRTWCRAPRAFQIQWFLHGYVHRADLSLSSALADRLKQQWLTAGEGEFLSLDACEIRKRLQAGVDAFEDAVGVRPDGFVPPAWLANANLAPALKSARITFTEDHRRIHDLARGRAIECPVITWATRTPLLKYGSLVMCPALFRRWRHHPVLRVALHPTDFNHTVTVRSVEALLRRALRTATPSAYGPDLFPFTPV